MKFNIELDSAKVKKSLANLQKALPKEIDKSLLITAQKGVSMILDRTAKGKGYEGKFRNYTPSYARAKAQGWNRAGSGRRSFGGDPSGVVNLNVRGEMLGSIQTRIYRRNIAEIYFSRKEEAKKAAFNNERRRWFGFNVAEQRELRNFFIRRFK